MDFATGDIVQSIASGDFDLDGKIDLVVAGQTSNGMLLLLGNGDGTFQSTVSYPTNFSDASISVLLNSFHGTSASLTSW